jgi:hypothetical protein
MLGRMVTNGWVARTRDDEDRRAWTISITRQGLALLDDRFPRVAAVQREILAPLPDALRPVFIHCLRLLIGLETAESDALPAKVDPSMRVVGGPSRKTGRRNEE